MEREEKIIFVIGVFILIIITCWAVIYHYKVREFPENSKSSETKNPPNEPFSSSSSFPPTKDFPINNIPAERKNIN